MMYSMNDIILISGHDQGRTDGRNKRWISDRYEQQVQVRQDEGINLILIYIIHKYIFHYKYVASAVI